MNRSFSFLQDAGPGLVPDATGQGSGLAVVLGPQQASDPASLRCELGHLEKLGWKLHLFVLATATELNRTALSGTAAAPSGAPLIVVADERALASRLIALDVPHIHAHSIGSPASAAANAARIAGITYSLSTDAGEIDDALSEHTRSLMTRAVFTLAFSGVWPRSAAGAASAVTASDRLRVDRVYLGLAPQSAAPMTLAELLAVCLRPLAQRSDSEPRHV